MKKITIIILCLATLFGGYGQQVKRSQLPNLAAKPLSFFQNQPKNGEMVGYNDAKSNDIQPLGEMKDVETWGSGTMIEDNTPVLFSQTHTWVPFNENFGYITDVTFKFYDGDMKVTKTVTVDVPDKTQRVTVLNQFSTRAFDMNTKFEFMIQVHYFVEGEGPSSVRDVLYVVNEDGEVIREVTECSGVVLVKNKNSFDRAIVYKIFTSNYEHEEGAKIVVESRDTNSWDLLHTFEFDEILTAYTTGYCFDIVEIEGIQYMFTAHYEKPWAISNGELDPETGEWSDPIPDLDNRYVITLYDMEYEVVKEMKFPLFGLKEQPLSTVSFGFFSSMKYDLTKNLYNNDDKFEVVYGMSRYIISCDCDQLDYYLLDEDGKELRRMDYSIMQSYPISAVKGFADQMVVILPEGEGGGTFRFIDAISWDIVVDFAGVYHGELLSFNFDRVAFGDSYAYVFGLGQAEEVGNKIYGGIVYYNSEGREVKKIRFLLPDDVQLWQPIISSETLNPHVFDVDDEVEYISFMKQGNGGKLINSFNIWKENGDVVYSWKGNSTDGDLTSAGFTYNDGKPNMLYTLFTNPNTDLLTSKFYELPFNIFSGGGSGTAEDPYVISTIAELELVRTYNKSHFVLANDIDLNDYSASDGKGWLPIIDFSGSFNGNGKTIKNMKIEQRDSSIFSGLFGNVQEGGFIKNLTLDNVNITGDNMLCGAIAGEIWGATVTGCHVRGTLNNTSILGGVVGEAVLFSSISDCSFEGTIESELSDAAGGIAGSIKTTSPITRCFSKGSVKGVNSIGGIAGSAMKSYITDCYSNMNIIGVRDLGGIAGYISACTVSNNYATGTVTAMTPESGFTGRIGGIIGYNAWSSEPTVTSNVAANSKITGANQVHRISGTEDEGTVVNCYANSAMLVGAAGAEVTITSTDSNSLDGADKALADMNKAFFESLTWKFGTNVENPWVGETGLPRLWFEFVVNGVTLNKTTTTLGTIGATEQLTATVTPTEAINKAVTWRSSNESVATVSETGLVTAVSNGAAVITVTTVDGGFTATCNVEVNVRVTSVALNKTELVLEIYCVKGGWQEQLIATITPENAANKAVTWSSSDSSIAEVDQNGMVSAHPIKGTAVITVTTVDGGFTATCNVIVDVIDGVNDVNENNIKLYHANNEIVIESEVELSNITIYDVSGKSIYSGNSNRIQTGNWNRGVYVVKVVDINNNIVSRKIVI